MLPLEIGCGQFIHAQAAQGPVHWQWDVLGCSRNGEPSFFRGNSLCLVKIVSLFLLLVKAIWSSLKEGMVIVADITVVHSSLCKLRLKNVMFAVNEKCFDLKCVLFFLFFSCQNKPVMAFGLVAITLCMAYLGYLHATAENKKELYEAVDSEGSRYMRRKTSKWD